MFGYKKHDIILQRPIVLIGMMGSGKTHLGRLLAKKLGLKFYDSDDLIEKKAGCSVAEIFERWGEQKFREVEAKTIQELVHSKPSVIATGGGAIKNEDTAATVFNHSYSVWVKADMAQILKRVARNENRPLLACENPQDVLKKLMDEREHIYSKAKFIIQSSDGNANAAIKTLLAEINEVN